MLLLCGALSIGLGVVVAAGYRLTIEDGEAWRELADKQRQRRLHVVPQRGTLYDRNGSALAVSVDVPSVSLDAVELMRGVSLQNQPAVARDHATRIAQALSLDPAQVERRILSKRRFAWLKRQISSEEAEAVRRLINGQDGEKIRGLSVDGEGRRYYPRRELAAPLLGFVAPDGEGKDGVEFALDQELRGHLERLQGLRDRNGRLIFSEGMDEERAFAGHDIHLSIDQGIQFVAERELALAAKTYEAVGGSVVVVDPRTGELLAIASWPGYNPNDYGQSEPEQRRNRAVSDRFEPGSTMKVFTVAAGLANKAITPTERLYCEKGRMPVDNVVIRDTHPAEWLTISQLLAVSSNICAAKVGLSLGGENLYEAFQRFGFGSATDLPLPGESSGVLLPRARPWVQVETAAAAFGQGISVTNVQMAMAVAALANDGQLMEPILVKRVISSSGEILQEAEPRVRRQAVPKSVARAVSEMMVAVTEGEGTGTSAALDGFTVAGKTATAQKADPATGQYSLDAFTASFVGFVPSRDPVVAISVVLDEPMVAHSGGDVAAPVFRRVAEMALKYRGLTPRGTERADLAQLAHSADPANATYALLRKARGLAPAVQETVSSEKPGAGQVRLPDMTGWPVRRVLKKAAELGLKAQINGSGLVARQTPAPGLALDKGSAVSVELEPAS
jgi:cell division protein FtsI (penicillin-binding protein 3)